MSCLPIRANGVVGTIEQPQPRRVPRDPTRSNSEYRAPEGGLEPCAGPLQSAISEEKVRIGDVASAGQPLPGTFQSQPRYTSAMPTNPSESKHGAHPSRRDFLRMAALTAGGVALAAPAFIEAQALPVMTVYKDPNCGCCEQWVEHVQRAGFKVTVRDTADMQTVKASLGVPDALGSCHTARIGAYTVEGHVPADLIKKMLAEKPAARGLAVPGMPIGSPGMEQGGRKDRYDVLLFDKAGKTKVYASR